MTLVAGIDSSTQSCKVVIRDADDGSLVRSGRASHPDGTEIHPDRWWDALTTAVTDAGGLDDVAAVAVGGQQHGMVCLDDTGAVVRDALLWNDTRSAPAARDLVDELGGAQAWADRVGVVPVASITATKLRWLADTEPDHADATAAVCLPHDWLSWRLRGAPGLDALVTDRSDASGTGYFAAATDAYDDGLLRLAFRDRAPHLPRVARPAETVGTIASGAVVAPGAGDNAAAALAVDARPGDIVVSLGTSGVVSAVSVSPTHDGSGYVAGFADATGQHLPLVCTLNGAPVLTAVARMLGVDLDRLAELALAAPSGADGVVLVPYFEGERSPDLPEAQASFTGLTLRSTRPETIARAAVEGLLCSLRDGLDYIRDCGVEARRILLVGGGVRSAAVRAIAPVVFGVPVAVPAPGEYVADGAARQAAWALSGGTTPPSWAAPVTETVEGDEDPAVMERYRAARTQLHG
ncbi:xylulokinase [Williamsia deligens]|uniref:Xylulose kinase n=1 Tax=Williamsia deligens TaxID=321325 RepID=A0ABW3GDW0_9NOCA|nr:xylulokinase [Williamsia deligens]MCP2195903.1 xylulokinase [Williamsia deligens]